MARYFALRSTLFYLPRYLRGAQNNILRRPFLRSAEHIFTHREASTYNARSIFLHRFEHKITNREAYFSIFF